MKKTAKIILVSAGAAMLMAGGVLGAVALYDAAEAREGAIHVKTQQIDLVWGEDGQHVSDKFEVAVDDLSTTATARYLSVAIAAHEDNEEIPAGTYKGTFTLELSSEAANSMILPKLAVEVEEDGTENKASMGANYKVALDVELSAQKTSALIKVSYKLTENFGDLSQAELTALAAETVTATADWNIYSEPVDPVFVDGYYITGKINGEAHWANLDGTAYSLPMVTENIGYGNYAELVEVDLKAGDEVRACKVENEQVEYYDVDGIENHGNYVAAVDGKYSFYLGGKNENTPLLYVVAPQAPVEPAVAVTASLYTHFAIEDEDAAGLKAFAWVWEGENPGAWYEATYVTKYEDPDRKFTISIVDPVGKGVLLALFDAEDLEENLPPANWWQVCKYQSGDGAFVQVAESIYADLGAKPSN